MNKEEIVKNLKASAVVITHENKFSPWRLVAGISDLTLGKAVESLIKKGKLPEQPSTIKEVAMKRLGVTNEDIEKSTGKKINTIMNYPVELLEALLVLK